ncbi:MAG TPA: hypothetical protein VNO26_05470 [Candidatus Limnocylindria bacterium]|nr:hypothetical protein [Candidatus Limnocylindria bacterium]
MPIPSLAAVLAGCFLLLVDARGATALTVLTVGKQAVFTPEKGRVHVGRDPRLSPVADPRCGGVETRVQLASYPQATNRLVAQDEVVLPCERWRKTRKGYAYEDPAGTAGGVAKVIYSARRLQVHFGGDHYTAPDGPVGYVELWFTVGAARLLARFHNFTTNDATKLATLKPSRQAAEGEALFWAVLHGDDTSDATQRAALDLLAKASDKNRKDGRSPFLCGMMHLYRYGRFLDAAGQPTAAARAAIDAAVDAFEVAEPRLWDGTRGDSRVPGFIAAAKFTQGFAHGNESLMNEGIADLQEAVEINAFFNVFDLIPVLQALPPGDPRWQQAFEDVTTYLEDPATIACVGTQPEICGNAGLAPQNIGGALVLFGDVYAKADNLERAAFWYGLAKAIASAPGAPWAFQDLADQRVLDVENRIARYQDGDPANDDPIIGIGEENCAVCHYR